MKTKKLNFYNLFYIFIIGCLAGYIIEFLWTFLKKGQLINHSAVVIGPFNFAYGICAVVFTLLLYRFKDCSYFKVFVLSFLGGSILEYVMSWGMELVVGFSAWDYSSKFMNINGRIALMYSIFWGVLGVLWIKFAYPYVMELIAKIKPKVGKIIMISLSIFLVFDILLTGVAIKRAKDCEKGIPPANAFEKFLDATFNQDYLKNMFNNSWEK